MYLNALYKRHKAQKMWIRTEVSRSNRWSLPTRVMNSSTADPYRNKDGFDGPYGIIEAIFE